MRSLPAAMLCAALTLAVSPGFAGSPDFEAQQSALDREAEQAFAENERLFREAEEVARRYKVDISAFRSERDGLRRERIEALRNGNKLKARTLEALLATNAANTLEDILVDVPPGPEQQRYRQRVREARASVEALKASLAPSGR